MEKDETESDYSTLSSSPSPPSKRKEWVQSLIFYSAVLGDLLGFILVGGLIGHLLVKHFGFSTLSTTLGVVIGSVAAFTRIFFRVSELEKSMKEKAEKRDESKKG